MKCTAVGILAECRTHQFITSQLYGHPSLTDLEKMRWTHFRCFSFACQHSVRFCQVEGAGTVILKEEGVFSWFWSAYSFPDFCSTWWSATPDNQELLPARCTTPTPAHLAVLWWSTSPATVVGVTVLTSAVHAASSFWVVSQWTACCKTPPHEWLSLFQQ